MRGKCSSILGIEGKSSFEKYLGFPIFNKRPVNSDFQFLVNNIREKLIEWKSNTLNIAGRTVLAKTTLSGISSHVMSYIKLPKSIVKTLDKTIRDFIWGSTHERKGMHLLSWDLVTKPKEQGGLEIHKMATENKAILSGLAWRVLQGPSATWKFVLQNKYRNHPVNGQRKVCVSRF